MAGVQGSARKGRANRGGTTRNLRPQNSLRTFLFNENIRKPDKTCDAPVGDTRVGFQDDRSRNSGASHVIKEGGIK